METIFLEVSGSTTPNRNGAVERAELLPGARSTRRFNLFLESASRDDISSAAEHAVTIFNPVIDAMRARHGRS